MCVCVCPHVHMGVCEHVYHHGSVLACEYLCVYMRVSTRARVFACVCLRAHVSVSMCVHVHMCV